MSEEDHMTDTLPDRHGTAYPTMREEVAESANFFRGLFIALMLSIPLWGIIGWCVATLTG
jgi:hypothetical protein